MSAKADQKKKSLYRQGMASLRLEGMTLEARQHRMILEYQSGKLTHGDFVAKALAYARTR